MRGRAVRAVEGADAAEEGEAQAARPRGQPRGVAGTLFVHKVAGALAESGADLATVTEAAQRVIAGTLSLGLSLDTCTVPGSPKENRIPPGQAELGLGIHGEAGIEQVSYDSAAQAMRLIAARLEAKMGPGPHVALLNNLGGAYRVLGDLGRAEELLNRALEIKTQVLGERHLETAKALVNLAIVLGQNGDARAMQLTLLDSENQEIEFASRVIDVCLERGVPVIMWRAHVKFRSV